MILSAITISGKLGSVEMHMNESPQPIYENRLVTSVPRLKASPRHGGARRFQHFFSHLNRRGGAPSGTAAFIAMLNDDPSLIISIIMIFMGNPLLSLFVYSLRQLGELPSLSPRGSSPGEHSLDPLFFRGIFQPYLELSQ